MRMAGVEGAMGEEEEQPLLIDESKPRLGCRAMCTR